MKGAQPRLRAPTSRKFIGVSRGGVGGHHTPALLFKPKQGPTGPSAGAEREYFISPKEHPTSLAVQWRTSELYWSDTTYNTISKSDLSGNNQQTLVSTGLDEPRDIALDPDNG